MSLIEIKDVSKAYFNRPALNHVNLNLNSGKIIGLCGPNGSGKTTLLKIMVRLLRDYRGHIQIDGQPLGPEALASVSYLPDQTYFEKQMKGTESIAVFKDMYPDFDEGVMYSLLEQLDVNANDRFQEMSKGMQEKFQLALVMSRKAKVYLLDEPIGGVDPASRDKILRTILSTYGEDSLLLISTHLIQDIESILDEVIFLKEGQVYLHENCDDLRERTGKSVDQHFREVF